MNSWQNGVIFLPGKIEKDIDDEEDVSITFSPSTVEVSGILCQYKLI